MKKWKSIEIEDLAADDCLFYDVIDEVSLGTTYELKLRGADVAVLVPVDDYWKLDEEAAEGVPASDPDKLILALMRKWVEMNGSLLETDRDRLLEDFDEFSEDYLNSMDDS